MTDWEEWERGYRQGRLDAAAEIRILADAWPWHVYDSLPKVALARAARIAEGNPNAIPAP